MLAKIKHIPVFLKEVKEELKNVNWSTRQELIAAAIIVVVASTLLTLYIFVIDYGLGFAYQAFMK